MPTIDEFNAGSGQIQVSDRGAESFAQAGRRVGAFYNQLGEDVKQAGDKIEQHMTDMQLSNTYASLSTAKVNGLKNWNQAMADPDAMNNPHLGDAFLQQYSQSIDDLTSHATTPQAKLVAARLGAEEKAQMADRVAGDMGHLAGAKWESDDQTFVNNTASAVADDPSSLAANLGAYEEKVNATIPGSVSGSERADLVARHLEPGLQKITMTAYLSAIERGRQQAATGQPTTALDQVGNMIAAKTGFDHLPGELQADLPKRVDEARRQGQEMYAAGQRQQFEAQDNAGKAEASALTTAVMKAQYAGSTPDPATMDRIYSFATRYPRLFGENHELLTMVGQAIDSKESGKFVQSDPTLKDSFDKRVLIPPGQPGALSVAEIIAARNNNQLSPKAASDLLEQQEKIGKDPDLGAALKQGEQWFSLKFRPLITKSPGLDPLGQPTQLGVATMDPQGDAAAAEAKREFHTAFEMRMRQFNETPAQAMQALTDPSSKAYFGNAMDYFKRAAASGNADTFFRSYPTAMSQGYADNPNGARTVAATQAAQGGPPPGDQGGQPTSQAVTIPIGGAIHALHAATAAPPRQPGESAAAYLKRTGG